MKSSKNFREFSSTHGCNFPRKSFTTKRSSLRQNNRTANTCGINKKMITVIFLSGGQWKSKKLMSIKFLQYQNRSLKKFILSILLDSYILSKTTPPNISFSKKKFILSSINILLLHIPVIE